LNKFKNVDEYIASFPVEIQEILGQVRETIKKAAPGAEEVISYGMPSFRQNGQLLYFAAYKNHIGFYPLTTGVEAFKTRLSAYKWTRGTIQFPFDKPLPVDLISKIVKFRVNENIDKSKIKNRSR
jgi:uncharacterized protein YdhG (YjbR/CyaY superfamily)